MTEHRKPKLGETVLYKSEHPDDMGNGATEVPAIVVRVWSDTAVNLLVLRDAPEPMWKTSVCHESIPGGSQSYRWPDA